MPKSEKQMYSVDSFLSSSAKFEAATGIPFDSELGHNLKDFVQAYSHNSSSLYIEVRPSSNGKLIELDNRWECISVDISLRSETPFIDSVTVEDGRTRTVYDLSNSPDGNHLDGLFIRDDIDKAEFNQNEQLVFSRECHDGETTVSKYDADGHLTELRVVSTQDGAESEHTKYYENGTLIKDVEKYEDGNYVHTCLYDDTGNITTEITEKHSHNADTNGDRVETETKFYEDGETHTVLVVENREYTLEQQDDGSDKWTSTLKAERIIDGSTPEHFTFEIVGEDKRGDSAGEITHVVETRTHEVGGDTTTVRIEYITHYDNSYDDGYGDDSFTDVISATEITEYANGEKCIREYEGNSVDMGTMPDGNLQVSIDGTIGDYTEKRFDSDGNIEMKTVHSEFRDCLHFSSVDAVTKYENGMPVSTETNALHGKSEIITYTPDGKVDTIERYSHDGELLTKTVFTHTETEIVRTIYDADAEVIFVSEVDADKGDILMSALDGEKYSLSAIENNGSIEKYVYRSESDGENGKQREVITIEYDDSGHILAETYNERYSGHAESETYRRIEYSYDGEKEKEVTVEKLSDGPVVRDNFEITQDLSKTETIVYRDGEPSSRAITIESMHFSLEKGTEYTTTSKLYNEDGALVKVLNVSDFRASVSSDMWGHDRHTEMYDAETGKLIETIDITFDKDSGLEHYFVYDGDGNIQEETTVDRRGNVLEQCLYVDHEIDDVSSDSDADDKIDADDFGDDNDLLDDFNGEDSSFSDN